LPPKYAAFEVPLWFNKLDLKDYLRSAYGVDVIHVRSNVTQAKVARKETSSPYTAGQLYRPASKKKMTVELVEPFVWPDPEEDLSPYAILSPCRLVNH
jgi:large subunit ribosomal protein L23